MVSPDLAAETLGVAPTASDTEIRRAYKRLALEHHPDHGGDPRRMTDINEAYSQLMSQLDAAHEAEDLGIRWTDLDIDETFEPWEETMWPEPPPGFKGLWRSLLAVVILPIALFAIFVGAVLLLLAYW